MGLLKTVKKSSELQISFLKVSVVLVIVLLTGELRDIKFFNAQIRQLNRVSVKLEFNTH